VSFWEVIDDLAEKSDYETYSKSAYGLVSAIIAEKWDQRTSEVRDECETVLRDLLANGSARADAAAYRHAAETADLHSRKFSKILRQLRIELEDDVRSLFKSDDKDEPLDEEFEHLYKVPSVFTDLSRISQHFHEQREMLKMDEFRIDPNPSPPCLTHPIR